MNTKANLISGLICLVYMQLAQCFIIEKVDISDGQMVTYIESPNFPAKYGSNTDVQFIVSTNLSSPLDMETARLLLTFDTFIVEPSSGCSNDFLEVQDGSDSYQRFCGVQLGRTVQLATLTPAIRFTSNNVTESIGFRIKVELIKSNCVFELNNVTQEIITCPLASSKYEHFDKCIWSLNTESGLRPVLKFNYMDILSDESCSQDFLAISAGGDFDHDVTRHCGTKLPVGVVEGKGTKVLISFTTGFRGLSGRGFSLNVTTTSELLDVSQPVVTRACPCGQERGGQRLVTRIVGGSEVRVSLSQPPHRYPWLAALATPWGNVFCGAALINDRYLVTASHCLMGMAPNEVKVLLGAHQLKDKTKYVELDVEELILHEQYVSRTQLNDIALVKLQKPISRTWNMDIVCIPMGSQDEFDDLRIAGWGRTEEGGRSSDVPLEVSIPQVPNGRCTRVFGALITPKKLCAGGTESRDSCQGDSGGPLLSQIGDRTYVTGVTSFGIGCGRESMPAVYTRVTQYVDWIDSKTRDANWCPKGDVDADEEDKEDSGVIPPLGTNLAACGLSNKGGRRKRVVGGSDTSPIEFPWTAAIGYAGQLIGAGVLVAPRFVLTSAKKVANAIKPWNGDVSQLSVLLGVHDVTKREPSARTYAAVGVHYHPKLGDKHDYNYDFALIELKEAADFRPVCLPWTSFPYYVGAGAIVAGWGRTSSYSVGSSVIKKATLNIMAKAKCQPTYQNLLTPQMTCASAPGRDACFGDEGGPLMVPKADRMYLIGIKSFGSSYGCALEGRPSIFADVRWSLPWLSSVTGLEVS